MEIAEIHRRVLEAILEDGALVGIPFYRRYGHLYRRLPLSEAQKYWREIKKAIEEVECICNPISVLREGDPLFRNGVSQNIYQLRQRVQARENFELTSKKFKYVLDSYESGIKTLNRFVV